MSLDALDPILTPPKRLACLGAIAAVKKLDFAALRDLLDISDSDLSKQLKALADAGYITSEKTGRGSTRRMWLMITPTGRQALADHTAALRLLTDPTVLATRLDGSTVRRAEPTGDE